MKQYILCIGKCGAILERSNIWQNIKPICQKCRRLRKKIEEDKKKNPNDWKK